MVGAWWQCRGSLNGAPRIGIVPRYPVFSQPEGQAGSPAGKNGPFWPQEHPRRGPNQGCGHGSVSN